MSADTLPATGAALPAGPSGLTQHSASRVLKNRVATVVMWGAFAIALIPLAWILWIVMKNGLHVLFSTTWWQKDQSGELPAGFDQFVRGARHAVVGTLLMAALTSLISVPIAVFTAIYLVEYGRGRTARLVSFMVDIMSGIPSIVAALFIFAIWVSTFGLKLIPACASLALTILMIPVVTRSTEEMLKLVPNELREASYALGVPRWRTIVSIVLPTAFSGIVTGILLGFARVAGETAPLLILAYYSPYLNYGLFSGTMGALPTFIMNQFHNFGDPIASERVWGASATLILLVLLISLLGRFFARFAKVRN